MKVSHSRLGILFLSLVIILFGSLSLSQVFSPVTPTVSETQVSQVIAVQSDNLPDQAGKKPKKTKMKMSELKARWHTNDPEFDLTDDGEINSLDYAIASKGDMIESTASSTEPVIL